MKITVDEFFEFLKHEILGSENSFIQNMKGLGKQDLELYEWMMVYLAWIEFGTEEDCKDFYWQYYKDLGDKDENI